MGKARMAASGSTVSQSRALRRRLAEHPAAVAGGQVAVLAFLLFGWEGGVLIGWFNGDLTGQPSKIGQQLGRVLASGELWHHLGVTLYEELLGFAIGMIGGTAIGLGLWWSRTLSRILEPFAVVFNGIPKIPLTPPMIVWFGIYETSKVVLAVTICFVVAWISAYAGVRQVDRDWLDMVRAMGGSRWQAYVRVVIPASMPWVISAMKVNIGFALVGAVVGEFVASNHGLGFMAVQAAVMFQISRLWMVIFVIMIVAALQYWAVLWLERRLLHWMGDERVRL
ncbi:MAG: ABC transporter permease [Alphaproteobacteria bacterium]|nr:ABC transporter permease [Alphaproteobacteria bacterium]